MLGKNWQGSADDILDTIAVAGYTGVTFSNNMTGNIERATSISELDGLIERDL